MVKIIADVDESTDKKIKYYMVHWGISRKEEAVSRMLKEFKEAKE